MKDLLYAFSYRLKGFRDVSIEVRDFDEAGNPTKWAVRDIGSVLNKLGEWEYESSPSNRDDEFVQRCRFDSIEEAATAFETWFNAQDERTQLQYKARR